MEVADSKPRSKRETILSRSKRIIGKQLPNDVHEQNDDDSGESVSTTNDTSKRRAQILKAQRTHRRRTQNYIQELEKEVLRLRARETELVEEVKALSTADACEMPTPVSMPLANGNGHKLSQLQHDTTSVEIDFTDIEEVEAVQACSGSAALLPRPNFTVPTIDYSAVIAQMSIKDTGNCTGSICGMDAQAAIDFILDLERPCLPHVKFDMNHQTAKPFIPPFNYGASHACTASATIMQSHQHIDFNTQKFSIPVSDIERLLAQSRVLPLGTELTPVQVWAMLTEISSAEPVSPTTFTVIKQEMAKYMRCNSFGTTIQIDTLRQLLGFFFPWYEMAPNQDPLLVEYPTGVVQRMDRMALPGWQDFF